MSIEKIIAGDTRSAARLMREIEEETPEGLKTAARLLPHTGRAHVIGITGAPGTGKSTLLDRLIDALRRSGRTVGVVVVDPTSPFSGGAILGDRVRMQRHATDPGVFIRSLASRGTLGGISGATFDIVAVMDAMGKEVILVETVGTGQVGVEVSRLAHTNIVVTIPETGDGVQAIKAGILESGEIFVVNKADLPAADLAAAELEVMLGMKNPPRGAWKPRVILTAPRLGRGVDELVAEIARHRAFLEGRRWSAHRERRIERRFQELLRDRLFEEAGALMHRDDRWAATISRIDEGLLDLHEAVETIVREMRSPSPGS